MLRVTSENSMMMRMRCSTFMERTFKGEPPSQRGEKGTLRRGVGGHRKPYKIVERSSLRKKRGELLLMERVFLIYRGE